MHKKINFQQKILNKFRNNKIIKYTIEEKSTEIFTENEMYRE